MTVFDELDPPYSTMDCGSENHTRGSDWCNQGSDQ